MNLQIDMRVIYLAVFVLFMRILRLCEHLVPKRRHVQIKVIVYVGYLLLEVSLVNGGFASVIVFLHFFIASHEGTVGDDMLHCLIEHVALIFNLFVKVLESTRACVFLIFF